MSPQTGALPVIANEQAVLFTDEMKAAFADHGVVYMVADWTNYDADIAASWTGTAHTAFRFT